jgi:5-dehydro-2-deoxygluconokinase
VRGVVPSTEAVVLGRAGADLYPDQVRTPLSEVRSFTRFAGGCAVNVAVGLARLGVETAIVSRVGSDGHGEFVRRFLTDERVDVGWLGTDLQYRTPLTFCEVWPPDRFPLTFYRQPTAPDWELTAESLDLDAIAGIPLLFASATGLARSPSREATMVALEAHRGTTVLDLDWRPSLWAESEEYAGLAREAARRVDVVVGTEGEFVRSAGDPDPEPAALALLEAGPSLAVIKRGAKGAIALEDGRRVESPGVDVEVVNGLGAGDAFAAGLGRGLLQGHSMEETLHRANVAGAIVASRLACSEAMPTADEVESFLERQG